MRPLTKFVLFIYNFVNLSKTLQAVTLFLHGYFLKAFHNVMFQTSGNKTSQIHLSVYFIELYLFASVDFS